MESGRWRKSERERERASERKRDRSLEGGALTRKREMDLFFNSFV